MKPIYALILCLIIASVTAAPASYSSSLTVEGDSAVVMGHESRTWESGTDLTKVSGQIYTGGTSGHQVLTAPGPVQYQQKNTLDASQSNVYKSTGYVNFKNGGVTSDSVSMDDSAPNITDLSCTAGNIGVDGKGVITGNVANQQYASGQRTAMGQSMELDTSKFVNDADITLSSKANWTGVGVYAGDFTGSVKTGATKNATVPSYSADVHDSFSIYTTENNTHMAVTPQNSWGDFSEAFVAETSNSTSLSDVNNETSADEPANLTGEEV